MLSKLLILLLVSYQPHLYRRTHNGFYGNHTTYSVNKHDNHTTFRKNGKIYAHGHRNIVIRGHNFYSYHGNYVLKNGKVVGKTRHSGNSTYIYDKYGKYQGKLDNRGFIGNDKYLKYFLFNIKPTTRHTPKP